MSKGLKKYIGTLQKRIANQRAEIERLHKEVETLTIKCNAWHLTAERVGEELQVARANAETLDILLKDYKSRNKEFAKANEELTKWCEELEAELNAAGGGVGKWTRSDEFDEQYGYVYKCSCCGALGWANKYCGNCGAKMKGE